MQIISGITDFQLNNDSAVAIGKFDGVHLGHRILIEDIVGVSCKDPGLKSVVFTFNPSPESLFVGHALPELTTTNEKRFIFDRMGVDVLIEFPMNQNTAAITAEEFVTDYLVKRMRAGVITAGVDLSFGYKGLGNADLLERLGKDNSYECHIIDKVTYKGEEISSTRIRNALSDGDMETVSALLGSPYRVSGVVAHGRKLGRTIGMPTANVIIPPDKMTGPKGVYYSKVYTAEGVYPAISNVGVKPTVIDDELLCCESYIYGYDRDIYGQYIEVELMHFVRPERKFEGIEELKDQMQHDIAGGMSYHHLLKKEE
ncbi:MAG: riboflavin biosynthesis protein RibF [Lachnospiraceae bacterium]|nr:riboflavin biosynthesis protein RibF [Lachnospiraceae bacterium]